MPLPIELLIIVTEPEAARAFSQRFESLPNVTVNELWLEEVNRFDCFVTAANSYGIMNAGIDAAVVKLFGEQVMTAAQDRIREDYLGEQPIGTSFLIPTGDPTRRFIAHTPTMRTPRSIDGTDKVYNAAFAAFRTIYRHNIATPIDSEDRIHSVVMCAMGCGFGAMSFSESARQMAVAYDHYLNPPHRLDNWDVVIARHRAITYDGDRRVVQ